MKEERSFNLCGLNERIFHITNSAKDFTNTAYNGTFNREMSG